MSALFEPAMFPFAVSICLLCFFVALELVLLVLGANVFEALDNLFPDLGEADAPETLSFAKVLGFIGIGKVPVLWVLFAFLATFGLSGYLIQVAAEATLDAPLALSAAVPLALVFTIIATGRLANLLGRILPSEESSAVSVDSLIGLTAVVSFGDATISRPAGAKVTDQHGNTHHIQVKASRPEEVLHEGQPILLLSRTSGFFIGSVAPQADNA